MNLTASGPTIRENVVPVRSAPTIRCTRCGATNPATTQRCRSCLALLPSKAAVRPVPRTVRPVVRSPETDFDTIFGELEALTKDEGPPPIRFQCPNCKRFVEESAVQCACGARFEEPKNVVRYECPRCGTRVTETATRCACGARFA